jgi:hypothetical protein
VTVAAVAMAATLTVVVVVVVTVVIVVVVGPVTMAADELRPRVGGSRNVHVRVTRTPT